MPTNPKETIKEKMVHVQMQKTLMIFPESLLHKAIYHSISSDEIAKAIRRGKGYKRTFF